MKGRTSRASSTGTPRPSGVPAFRGSGVPAFRHSRVPAFRCSCVPVFPDLGTPEQVFPKDLDLVRTPLDVPASIGGTSR
jgi:hypothetical protein